LIGLTVNDFPDEIRDIAETNMNDLIQAICRIGGKVHYCHYINDDIKIRNERIKRLYKEGVTIINLSYRFNLSKVQIKNIINQKNDTKNDYEKLPKSIIKLRQGEPLYLPNYTYLLKRLEMKKIIKRYRQGVSYKELAKEFNKSERTIRRITARK